MSEKLIDLALLRDIADELSGVARNLQICTTADVGLPAAVGSPELGDGVERFQVAWSAEREALAEELAALATAVTAAADQFEEADQVAATAIAEAVFHR